MPKAWSDGELMWMIEMPNTVLLGEHTYTNLAS
jgi:hypothetical protein